MTGKETGYSIFAGIVLAGISSAVTWYFTKKYNEKKWLAIVNKEVDETRNSLRNYYRGNDNKEINENKPKEEPKAEPVKKNESPIRVLENTKKNVHNKIKNADLPKFYYIEPVELNEDNYETLYYYADGVLADVNDNRIVDIENTIGDIVMLQTFNYSDSDEICIRNEISNKDFQVLLVDKEYVVNEGPEDE